MKVDKQQIAGHKIIGLFKINDDIKINAESYWKDVF